MSDPQNAVVATERAIALIETLSARFGPLMFVQSGAAAMAAPRSACRKATFCSAPKIS